MGNDNNLEKITCTWKQMMNQNLQGKGTSFSTDIKKYNQKQLKCYRCNGLETQLPCYFPNED